MSVYAVAFDPATGEILNRVSYGTQEQLQMCCPNSVEISPEEYMEQPELTKKVDLKTKRLVEK